LGGLYNHERNPQLALDYFKKSVAIKEKIKSDEIDLSKDYHGIGLTFHSLLQFDEAQ